MMHMMAMTKTTNVSVMGRVAARDESAHTFYMRVLGPKKKKYLILEIER